MIGHYHVVSAENEGRAQRTNTADDRGKCIITCEDSATAKCGIAADVQDHGCLDGWVGEGMLL